LVNCGECGRRLPDGQTICPECGGLSTVLAEGATGDEVHRLLASANLARIRRQWHEAEARCSEALRLQPDSASAHALLGDIYRDRGRLRDAIEWYKQSLDLNPRSRRDREKLDNLIDRVYSRQALTAEAARASRPERVRPSLVPLPRPMQPFRTAVVVLLGALCLGLVAFLVYRQAALTVGAPADTSLTARQTAPPPAPVAPPPPPPEIAGLHLPIIPPSPAPTAGPYSGRESDLRVALEPVARELSPSTAVTGVSLQPGEETASISYDVTLAPPMDATQKRHTAVHSGLTLAKAAAAADARLKWVELRCYGFMDDGSGRPSRDIIMTGSAQADKLRQINLSTRSTDDMVYELLSSRPIWWARGLR
jgi:hypothetical protein